MSNHTPEPWSKNAISPTVYDGDGIAILRCEGRTLIAENEANARRIVACVNACVGVSDDALDGGWEAAGLSAYANRLEVDLAAVTAQRDELIDELDTTKKALAMAVNTGPDSLLELAKKDIGYYMTEAVKTVIAQRDELLQTVKAVQTMCHGAIRVRIDGIIAKCEAQNDER